MKWLPSEVEKSSNIQIWSLRKWFSGRLGTVLSLQLNLTVRVSFQHKWFCHCMNLNWSIATTSIFTFFPMVLLRVELSKMAETILLLSCAKDWQFFLCFYSFYSVSLYDKPCPSHYYSGTHPFHVKIILLPKPAEYYSLFVCASFLLGYRAKWNTKILQKYPQKWLWH